MAVREAPERIVFREVLLLIAMVTFVGTGVGRLPAWLIAIEVAFAVVFAVRVTWAAFRWARTR